MTEICEPIFRFLRQNQPTVRNDDCLISPPILVPLISICPLILYLSVSNITLGCMLDQLDDSGNEQPIYYLSKRMLEYEMRYVVIERLIAQIFVVYWIKTKFIT